MTTATQPITHSYSRLIAYSACPLSFRMQYLDKVPLGGDTSALEIGSASHTFFEKFIRGDKRFDNTEEKAFDAYVLALAAECFQQEPRSQENFPAVLEVCQIFAKSWKPDPAFPVVKTEVPLAFDAKWKPVDWFSKDVRFRAKIDMIEEPQGEIKKIRVTDFKTSYAGAADPFQNAIYAFVCSLVYPGLQQVEVVYLYTRSGFKNVKLYNCEDMDIVKIQIEALVEKIEADRKFKARPGARCLSCPCAGSCQEKPSDLVQIDSKEVAEQLAGEVAFLDAQKKAKTRALSAWCKKQGPVETGGLVYNHYPAESLVIDMAPLLSLCVQFNVDPSNILNPDSRAFKKACRDNPGFGEAIAPYVGVDVSMRFYSKKAEGDDE